MDQLPVSLAEVDRVEVLTLIDNFIDVLLESTDIVIRPPLAEGEEIPTDTLLAEHGLSLLVTVMQGGREHTILFDTGYSQIGMLHNMERLGVKAEGLKAIVLSHAHMDHTGSLYPLLEKIPNPIPLVVHPDVFQYPRFIKEKDGTKRKFPRTLIKEDLERKNIKLKESKGPTLIADHMVMVTGEVERDTEFEKGLPNAFMEKNGKVEADPITDDQSLVIHLKGKGLVIVSGCSHAGIINTVRYAKKITGEEKIYGVLGGFHLTGPFFEKIIDRTVMELKAMGPEVVVPMHCTGRKAMERFSEAFSDIFILNSVGSKITLG